MIASIASVFQSTYPFELDVRLLDLKPTGSHDFTLHDEKLKCTCIASEYSGKGWAGNVRGNLGFYGWNIAQHK